MSEHNINKRLESDFDAIVDTARAYAAPLISSGDYAPQPFQWVSHRVKFYPPESGLVSPQVGVEVLAGESQHLAERSLKKFIESLEVFQGLEEIREGDGSFNYQASMAISCLPSYLASSIIKGEPINIIKDRFLKSVTSEDLPRHCILTLYGVKWEAKQIEIQVPTGVTVIRAMSPEDYAQTVDLASHVPRHAQLPTTLIHAVTTLPEDRGGLNQSTGMAIVRAMTLYRFGCVRWATQGIYSEALEYGSSPQSQFRNLAPRNDFIVTEEMLPALRIHCESIWTQCYEIERRSEGLNYLDLSFNEYVRALEAFPSRDGSVPTLVRGLEALLLRDDKEGIAHILSSRVALLADAWGYDYLKVQKAIKETYNIRSKFVHGDVISSKDDLKWRKSLDEIGGVQGLFDLARRLLLFAHMRSLNKEDLLAEISAAMLSKAGRQAFEKTMTDCISASSELAL